MWLVGVINDVRISVSVSPLEGVPGSEQAYSKESCSCSHGKQHIYAVGRGEGGWRGVPEKAMRRENSMLPPRSW